MDNVKAKLIADEIVAALAPGCERIEIAGSLRRGKPQVKDIEIVCVPKALPPPRAVFGQNRPVSTLDARLLYLDPAGQWHFLKSGDRYKQITSLFHGINLDLFIVLPPRQWGVLYTIRTGPADYSKWLVTSRLHGGARPAPLKVSEGAVWNGDEMLETPEEQDFYEQLQLEWQEPDQREARWGQFSDGIVRAHP